MNGLGQAGTEISENQRAVHLTTEAVALLMVPAIFSAARSAKGKHKKFLNFLGWATLIVDGGLLINWWLQRRKTP